MKKRLLSVVLALTMVLSVLSGCGNQKKAEKNIKDMTPEEYYDVASWKDEEKVIDDNYRNFYEVFVYSFCDSNGDGIGDINGLISKLDYIQDMGFNGIWLMPIHKSTTYHKYDVIDYYSIDPQYGTMDDFDRLIEECDKRGIKVIIDLVFNHTSSQHEWFKEATKYLRTLQPGQGPDPSVCPYVEYYNFKKQSEVKNKSTYYKVGGSEYSYEGMFWDQMPDLNLECENVKKEIEKIASFWLEKGVGGFRLDAAKEYFSGNIEKNIAVLKWFSDYVTGIDKDAYIVAEVWENYSTIKKYYASGITSIFDYNYGNSIGKLVPVVNQAGNGRGGKSLAEEFLKTEQGYLSENPDMINAPFLSNHDTGRIAGFVNNDISKMKMAGALNIFMGGAVFVYYGEELGMSGSGKDENKRAGMYWSKDSQSEGMCKGPSAMDSFTHKFDSLEEQSKDKFSIYWYYKNALHLRNKYPEIARGKLGVLDDIEDGDICAVSKTYQGETTYIIYNISGETKKVKLSKDLYDYKGLSDYLAIDEKEVTMKGDTLTIPAYGIAIVK